MKTADQIKAAVKELVKAQLPTARPTDGMVNTRFDIGGDCPVRAMVEYSDGMYGATGRATSALVLFADGDRWLLGGNGSMRWRRS